MKKILCLIVCAGAVSSPLAATAQAGCGIFPTDLSSGPSQTRLKFTADMSAGLEEIFNGASQGTVIASGEEQIDLFDGFDCSTVSSDVQLLCAGMSASMPVVLDEPVSDCVDIDHDLSCSCESQDPGCTANEYETSFLGLDFFTVAHFDNLVMGQMTVDWISRQVTGGGGTEYRPALRMRIEIPDGTSLAVLDIETDPDFPNLEGTHSMAVEGGLITLWLEFDNTQWDLVTATDAEASVDDVFFPTMGPSWETFVKNNFIELEDIEDQIADQMEDVAEILFAQLVSRMEECVDEVLEDEKTFLDSVIIAESGGTALAVAMLPAPEDLGIGIERLSFDTVTGEATFAVHSSYSGHYDYDDYTPTVTLLRQSRTCPTCSWFEITNPNITDTFVDHGETDITVEIPADDYLYRVEFYADPLLANVNDTNIYNNTKREYLTWDPDYAFYDDCRDGIRITGVRAAFPPHDLYLNVNGRLHNLGLSEDPAGVLINAYWDSSVPPAVDYLPYGMGVFNGYDGFQFTFSVGSVMAGTPVSVYLDADPDGLIAEGNEDNNDLWVAYANDAMILETTRDILSLTDLWEPDYYELYEFLILDWVAIFDEINFWWADVGPDNPRPPEELRVMFQHAQNVLDGVETENLEMIFFADGTFLLYDPVPGGAHFKGTFVSPQII